tara:strand:+ start:1668 stop:1889 length:222 start_codon:yes stop_codon:yes gene_type:complete
MNDKKRLLKKALGILIHLSELSGRTKSQHKKNHDLNSADYYLLRREELKKLIINYADNLDGLNKELSLFQKRL